MPAMDTLGPRVKRLRQAAGLSLEGLAARTDLSWRTIARVEAGDGKPTRSTLRLLAEALGLTVDELLANGDTEAA